MFLASTDRHMTDVLDEADPLLSLSFRTSWKPNSTLVLNNYGTCSLQFPYKVDIPLVTIIVDDEWNSVADATAIFKLAPNYSRSSWDWIGLFKVTNQYVKLIL